MNLPLSTRHWLSTVLLLSPAPLLAQPAAQSPPEAIKLTLHASAVTQPALQYTLLPEKIDQQRGNAATAYFMAAKLRPNDKEMWDRDYLAMPLDKLPREDVQKFLAPFAETFDLLQTGAMREEAHWDSTLRERGISTPLPYLNDMRAFANLLNLRCRLELARQDWPAALRTMQTLMGMARQLNEQPVLIQGLVEQGMLESMLHRCAEGWIADGKSANLYWALSSLPSPFVDLHALAQWERAEVGFTDPQLRLALREQLPAEQWRAVIAMVVQLGVLADTAEHEAAKKLSPADDADNLIRASLDPARKFLAASGTSAEQLAKMPPEQIVGTYLVRQYHQIEDELWKGWELPIMQAAPLIAQGQQKLTAALGQQPVNPLLKLLPRRASNARYNFAQTDRHIALLRTIEVIRDYAAHHDGQPPKALSEITELPLPADPFTGKPFGYSIEGKAAVVVAPPPSDAPLMGWRYELQFVK
jgi:hypothetical protein